ncbi:MAG: 50S ribosomal protein L13 [Candidatus Pacebacteria bacterium]|nr:50S ribosomal protein L13 [Candidatus Paceibacterota bacterium]
MKEYTIDATNKKVGRVATEAAKVLMGKDDANYQSNVVADVSVNISNASKADISEKKKEQKIYKRFSGYPGGLKETKMNKLIEKKGYSEVFKNAIYGMLPGNKLRKKMMNNLKITE